jgi:hypothetical protein
LFKVLYWGFWILGVNGRSGIGFVVEVGGTTTYPKSVETLAVISGLCNNFFQFGILATATNSVQTN